MASLQMTSTPVQRQLEKRGTNNCEACSDHCLQFIGFSPIVRYDSPVTKDDKSLSKHLHQVRHQQCVSPPVPYARRPTPTWTTCEKCTPKKRVIPAQQRTRRGTLKPMMGMTVIIKDTPQGTYSACDRVLVRQPVMGVSVTRKIERVTTVVNTGVMDDINNYTTPTSSSRLEHNDEGYCSGSYSEQSITGVMTQSLPEDESIITRSRSPMSERSTPGTPVCLFPSMFKRSRGIRRPRRDYRLLFSKAQYNTADSNIISI